MLLLEFEFCLEGESGAYFKDSDTCYGTNDFVAALKLKYDEMSTRLHLFDLYIKMRNLKSAASQIDELKKNLARTISSSFLTDI